ncbi:hypothetical protein [Methyloceanibacter stevinii]|uniref:hypothetical protein n=1 Tax=Methyloceanibacter stevinii TaxID=1774970 RepID=UPI00114C90AE|nr:hypothetical protein [Methyloceanibacter stevinii]
MRSEARPLDINPIIDNALPHELAAPGAPLLIAAPTLLQIEIGSGELAIHVTYDTGGDQHLIQVQQLNVMWDNDIAIPEGWSAEALQALQFRDVAETLQDLHDQAAPRRLQNFPTPPSTQGHSYRSPANTMPNGKPWAKRPGATSSRVST